MVFLLYYFQLKKCFYCFSFISTTHYAFYIIAWCYPAELFLFLIVTLNMVIYFYSYRNVLLYFCFLFIKPKTDVIYHLKTLKICNDIINHYLSWLTDLLIFCTLRTLRTWGKTIFLTFSPCFCLSVCLSQAVMNRIHTISVPYAVMKACPLSWVQRVHVQKGI